MVGQEIYNFFSPYITDVTYQQFGKDWHGSFWQEDKWPYKMLLH